MFSSSRATLSSLATARLGGRPLAGSEVQIVTQYANDGPKAVERRIAELERREGPRELTIVVRSLANRPAYE